MTKQVQRRRGTDTQHTSFTGAEGEISVNTTNKSIHVHDGATAGGIEAARADLGNVSDADLNSALTGNTLSSLTITSADINGGTIDGTVIGGSTAAAGSFTTLSASTSITGTLATAAQTNITSVGTLTGLTVSGSTSLAGASTSADITFGDNDKAIFGAGSDLQVYHSGADSFIIDSGTGSLNIRGTNFNLSDASGTHYLTATSGAEVSLKYAGGEKLATTSTGIDVTGTVTADGLTVDSGSTSVTATLTSLGNGVTDTASIDIYRTNSGHNTVEIVDKRVADLDGGNLVIRTSDTDGTMKDRVLVGEGGDISFYEDTGTTAKFFWDASAESLVVGTTSTAGIGEALYLNGGGLFVTGDLTSTNADGFTLGYDGTNAKLAVNGTSGASRGMTFGTVSGGVEGTRMTIDSSGNVGIGTSSPAHDLQIGSGTNSATFGLKGSTVGPIKPKLTFEAQDGSDRYIWEYTPSGNPNSDLLSLSTNNNAHALTVLGSGNVGIGTSSPAAPLHISAAGAVAPRIESSNGAGDVVLRFYSGATYKGQVGWNQTDDVVGIYSTTTSSVPTIAVDGSNVGIGTSSPAYKVSVGQAGDKIGFSSGSNYGYFEPYDASGNMNFMINWAGGSTEAITFGTSTVERLRIDSSGHAIIPAGVTLGTSVGVYNAANTLDDYEEGTFTPTVSSGVTSPTYSSQSGSYTKIGNYVYFQIRMDLASGTPASTQFQITNLPFTSKNVANYGGAFFSYSAGFIQDLGQVTLHIGPSTSTVYFYKSSDGAVMTGIEVGNAGNILNGFYINGVYLAA